MTHPAIHETSRNPQNEIDRDTLQFNARLKQAQKPLTGLVLSALGTAAVILAGLAALAIKLS
jgi:hypothetical protein